MITNTILGVPYYGYSFMGPQILSSNYYGSYIRAPCWVLLNLLLLLFFQFHMYSRA